MNEDNNIYPIWLIVEYAIIDFMSVMNKARKEDQRIEIEGNRIKINAELKRRCIEMMNPK